MDAIEFRKLLFEMSEGDIVRKHIVNSESGPNVTDESLRYIENVLRSKFQMTADQHISAIVVGSAKLGFSFISKKQNGNVVKPAYREFQPGRSDIDIAVVSPVLYDKIWSDLAAIGAKEKFFPVKTKLTNYMYHGWIRPDKFTPPIPQRCADWNDAYTVMCRNPSLRNKRLRLALYHSQFFLEIYQQRGIRMAREQEEELSA